MSSSEPDRPFKILLFGLGAIGGFYAYILGKNKNVSLSVIARSNYDAVKQNGIKLESDIHGKQTASIDHVYKSIQDISTTFDYIVCAHKAINYATVPPLFNPVTNDQTTFVIIQNGVGNEEPFRITFPSNTIISCVTWTGAVQKTPGTITHNTNENIQIGLFPNLNLDAQLEQTRRLQTFAGFLEQGGTQYSIESDIQIARWEKVVWNAAWNPLTTLTGLPVQNWLRTSPEAETFTRQLMEDVIAVGRRLGVLLKDGLADQLIAKVVAMETPIYSSMYQDAQSGRPLEMEVIVGFPMQKANELGMEVPGLKAIYALTNAVNLRLTAGAKE
ncbi:2-dehydropantoate 2-reductase [Cercospora zeina]